MGDFNIHYDRLETVAFTNILDYCNLKRHVHETTHNREHVLDLIITWSTLDIIRSIHVFDPTLSDHSMVICLLDVNKPRRQQSTITYRKIKDIHKTQS